MSVCFEGDLVADWSRIARTMRELGKRNEASSFLWDFLDFVVTHRTPLYILMQPFMFQKVSIKRYYLQALRGEKPSASHNYKK